MIHDKLSNCSKYYNLHPNFKMAFDYLFNADLSGLKPGKYEIDNTNVFALVQDYLTKDEEDCKPEAHIDYIDIQYIVSGNEIMGHILLAEQKQSDASYPNDVAYFITETNKTKINVGEFMIFFNNDIHQPGIKHITQSAVRKVVVKVKQ